MNGKDGPNLRSVVIWSHNRVYATTGWGAPWWFASREFFDTAVADRHPFIGR